MRALARAVDAKDSGTADHSLRVGNTVRRLAVCAGWSNADAERLSMAGYVHDVGKIGVTEEILLKPSALNASEYRVVRLHPETGAEMMRKDELWTDEQIEWVLHHHERPDGLGYPHGLPGHAISDGAALLALADTWDVMISDRPYKKAMSVPAALNEVRELCGRQFRHFAVTALERMLAAS